MSNGWEGRREAGSLAMMRYFVRMVLWTGPRIGRWLLWPVAVYFFLVRRDERAASRAFLSRVLDRPVRRRDEFRHVWTFAQVLLDRIFLVGADGRGITVECDTAHLLDEALAEGRGCIMMGSHLGSFEACREVKRSRPDLMLRIVMHRRHSAKAMELLDMLNPELAAQALDLDDAPGTVLALQESLEIGSLAGLLADRVRGAEPSAPVQFLGEPTRMPVAPHQIAMLTQAPTVLFFGIHIGPHRYRVIFERFPTPAKAGRGERGRIVAEQAQRFAQRLEHHARAAPYNWFNFYDFWAEGRP